MHYIYKITNLINNKIYIGQAKYPNKRWSQHKQEAKKENPSMIINKAMKKHGVDNFKFEIIASCLDLNEANKLEESLIKENESHISLGKGYNVSLGGSNAPKTEEWKANMRVKMAGKNTSPNSQFKKGHISLYGGTWKKGNAPWNKKVTLELKNQLILLNKTGISARKLAKQFGLGKTTVLRFINS